MRFSDADFKRLSKDPEKKSDKCGRGFDVDFRGSVEISTSLLNNFFNNLCAYEQYYLTYVRRRFPHSPVLKFPGKETLFYKQF